jgi:hypothetical protein
MPESFVWMGIKLETPAEYRIRVQGSLDESWSDRLGGMAITTRSRDAVSETTLVGHLTDQVALVGVLNMLYELHMPILEVEMLLEED